MPALVIYLRDNRDDKALLKKLRTAAKRQDTSVSAVCRSTLKTIFLGDTKCPSR